MPHCLESPTQPWSLQLNTWNSTHTFFEARISSSAVIVNAPEGGRPLSLFPFVSQENELPSLAELCSGSPNPGSPGSPRSLWVPSLVMKAEAFHTASWSSSQLFALLAHSSTIPRLLSFSSFSLTLSLTYFFPLLLKRSQIETPHNRSPRPSSQLPLNSHHPSFIPSIHQNNDKHHQRLLTNRPVDSLIILYLSRPHPPHLPLVFPLIVPHSEKAQHHIICLIPLWAPR